jgi:hypothetical protein
MEIHTAEPLVSQPSPFEVEIAVPKLMQYKSHSNDQILPELTQAGGETSCTEIHKLINFLWNKEELPQQWKECIKFDKTECSNFLGISVFSTSCKILSISSQF